MGAVGDVSSGYTQLLRVVGCLVNELRSFNDYKVAACADRVEVSCKQLGKVNRDANFSRDTIFNEVREVNEREKRKGSLILREFDCNSVNEVCDKFKEVCHMLNVGANELSDVAKIGGKKLFRAKVLNAEKRSELLMVTGRLRTMSGFENLYIQKDLTFRQRQELSERRSKARMRKVDGGVAIAGSFGMNGHVSIGRGRGSSRGQVSSKVGKTVYGSTPHVSRKSLN